MVEDSSEYLYKTSCSSCGSRDNLAVYSDGGEHCFSYSCGYHKRGTGESTSGDRELTRDSNSKLKNFISGETKALPKRMLTEETCRRWGYTIGVAYNKATEEYEGCQIANYYSADGQLTAQKLKFANKEFSCTGKPETFFGRNMWSSGRYLVITEGEIDAMSYSQATNYKYPVVSLPNGAQSAKKVIQRELKWLEESFEKIVLMFDSDEVGQEAAKEVAVLFSPNKCLIAKLPEKDANDMLKAGRVEELVNAVFRAKPYRPDTLTTIGELREKLDKPVEWGLSYPWPYLTELTYGARLQEFIVLGAGTGCGKTETYKELIVHFRQEHNQKVGVLFLEEAATLTATTLAGKIINKRIHVPDVIFSKEEKEAALDLLEGDPECPSLVLYDSFGGTDYANIQAAIRHMAVAMECKWVFLDHITALVSGEADKDTTKILDMIATKLGGLCRELDITIYAISHLNTAEGDSHEEGGRVKLSNIRGSRGLAHWCSFVIGLERDQQDAAKANHVTMRILKDRYTGQSTGFTFDLKYSPDTGRLTQVEGSKARAEKKAKSQAPKFKPVEEY